MRAWALGMVALMAGCSMPALAADAGNGTGASSAARAPSITPDAGALTVRGARDAVRVDAITDDIVRVRVLRDGQPMEDASWAVESATRRARVPATLGADTLATARLRVAVDPQTLALRVTDAAGRVVVEDAAQPISRDGRAFTLRKRLAADQHIFGLGDKTGALDRRGGTFVDWNTDAYGFRSSDDPIYKSIPFYICTDEDGRAYGLFLDNSYRVRFDFGHAQEDVIELGGPDGPIDYYVINGPTVADVVRHYAELTGKPPMMPRWALGYQQSRWGYSTAQQVRDLAARLRKEAVPTDVIWQDIDYQDRNRPFTINRTTYPDFAGLAKELDGQGIKYVAIVDLHIAHAPGQGYVPYDTGMAGNHFVHNPDGSTYVAPVWPGPSVFPDFTRAATRDWFGRLYKMFTDAGIAGIWNDMNEPAVFETRTKTMPLDTVHRIDSDDFAPRSADHREIHNVFGMQNTRATYDGLRRLRPDERAFVMTRASYAGGQRYAVTWTGDNSSSWDHLKLSIAQIMNLGLSGFAWSGADVGGFTGGATPDLMTRWFEIAAFLPIFRDHSAKDGPFAEPWVDGPAHLAIRRHFVEERYRLMPFLYALAATNAASGEPMMRPVFYDYPGVVATPCDSSANFTLGGRMLVGVNARIDQVRPYRVCLPTGGWYDYWTGARVAGVANPGGRFAELTVAPDLASLPVFVRAGTILPRQALVSSTAQKPAGPLELHVYPGPDCQGLLYDDDGHSLAFQRGGYARQTVRCSLGADGSGTLSFDKRTGTFKPWWSAIMVVVHGVDGTLDATADGRALAVTRQPGMADTVAFTLSDMAAGGTITLVRK